MTTPVSREDVYESFETHKAWLDEPGFMKSPGLPVLPELYQTLSAYVIQQGKVNADKLASLQSLANKHVRLWELELELKNLDASITKDTVEELEKVIAESKEQAEKPYAFAPDVWSLAVASSLCFKKVDLNVTEGSEASQRAKVEQIYRAVFMAKMVFSSNNKVAYERFSKTADIQPMSKASMSIPLVFEMLCRSAHARDDRQFESSLNMVLKNLNEVTEGEHQMVDALIQSLEEAVQQAKVQQKLAV